MRFQHLNWTRILTILLVILASYALLYITFSIILRFTQAILIFVVAALLAYVLMPLVNRLHHAFRVRWLAIIFTYALIAVGIFALGYLLFTPFIEQSQSLVDNLQNPSPSSLQTIKKLQRDSGRVNRVLQTLPQLVQVGTRQPAPIQRVLDLTSQNIQVLQADVQDVKRGVLSGPIEPSQPPARRGHLPPNPQPQTQVPPSYVSGVSTAVDRLLANYTQATQDPSNVDLRALRRAVSNGHAVTRAAVQLNDVVSTTPILLLRSQVWLDQHSIRINLHSKFGEAAKQVSNQGTNILNNAITIVQDTVNALLDITLILIIAFYFLNDGPRMTRRSLQLVPTRYREQARFFITSLDNVLGGYVRGQIFLAVLAGILGGAGAAVLGVPYPLLIGLVTALLELIPVIGPMVAVLPAVGISLFFMPLVTTGILFAWFLIFQQIVTNIIGPRIMGMAVGIHPLEALIAVLVGYPIGGFLGAFLAVPVMGIVHILLREIYNYFVVSQSGEEAEQTAEREAKGEPALRPLPRQAGSDRAVR